MKKLSIVIPCYNVENYIQRCSDSLTAQTLDHAEIELIFVNDASADDTLSILLSNDHPAAVICDLPLLHIADHV